MGDQRAARVVWNLNEDSDLVIAICLNGRLIPPAVNVDFSLGRLGHGGWPAVHQEMINRGHAMSVAQLRGHWSRIIVDRLLGREGELRRTNPNHVVFNPLVRVNSPLRIALLAQIAVPGLTDADGNIINPPPGFAGVAGGADPQGDNAAVQPPAGVQPDPSVGSGSVSGLGDPTTGTSPAASGPFVLPPQPPQFPSGNIVFHVHNNVPNTVNAGLIPGPSSVYSGGPGPNQYGNVPPQAQVGGTNLRNWLSGVPEPVTLDTNSSDEIPLPPPIVGQDILLFSGGATYRDALMYLHHLRNMRRAGGNPPILAPMRELILSQVDTAMRQVASHGVFDQRTFDRMLQTVRDMYFELGLINEEERGTWRFDTGAGEPRA